MVDITAVKEFKEKYDRLFSVKEYTLISDMIYRGLQEYPDAGYLHLFQADFAICGPCIGSVIPAVEVLVEEEKRLKADPNGYRIKMSSVLPNSEICTGSSWLTEKITPQTKLYEWGGVLGSCAKSLNSAKALMTDDEKSFLSSIIAKVEDFLERSAVLSQKSCQNLYETWQKEQKRPQKPNTPKTPKKPMSREMKTIIKTLAFFGVGILIAIILGVVMFTNEDFYKFIYDLMMSCA